jgi:hypothetical protein
LAPLARTFSLETRVPDPTGAAPWVLVVWRTRAGGWCSYPGRERGGQILGTTPNGALGGFPFQEGGSCSERPLDANEATVLARTFPGGPTVVHGVAGKDVVKVRVPSLPGVGELTPSKRGAFMAVLPDEIRAPTLRVVLEQSNGSQRVVG